MDNDTKRLLLFLFGCMGTRLALVWAAYKYPGLLRPMGFFALAISIGFMYIFVNGLRKTGVETFGDKIWWNELWMGWPVDESYQRSSNVVDAAKLQGKLMLIVGELDENVDPASTLQVSAALVRAGKDHELVVVPGAGHGAAETAYGSAKRLEFLKRYLQSEMTGK